MDTLAPVIAIEFAPGSTVRVGSDIMFKFSLADTDVKLITARLYSDDTLVQDYGKIENLELLIPNVIMGDKLELKLIITDYAGNIGATSYFFSSK